MVAERAVDTRHKLSSISRELGAGAAAEGGSEAAGAVVTARPEAAVDSNSVSSYIWCWLMLLWLAADYCSSYNSLKQLQPATKAGSSGQLALWLQQALLEKVR